MKFLSLILPVWGLLWYRNGSKGPLIIFAQYGKLFGTGRIFRHYLYSGLAIWSYTYIPFLDSLTKTAEKTKINLEK
jgi:hypothetical protein